MDKLDRDLFRSGSSEPLMSACFSSNSYAGSLLDSPQTKKNPDILRVVSPARVLEGFGKIFTHKADGPSKGIVGAAADLGEMPGHSLSKRVEEGNGGQAQMRRKTTLEEEAVHAEADDVFYKAKQATDIDAFISHVWSAPRWKKTLALLYYRNVRIATISAILMWILSAILCITVLGGGDAAAFGGQDLVPQLVWAPMATFFLMFFFGHMIPFRPNDQKWWLDKMCVHQSRLDVQELGLLALPEFVASSKRIIILWSETYFERAWCNAEVATFAAVNSGADQIDFLPLWLAPWILGTIFCDLISITVCNRLFAWITEIGMWMEQQEVNPDLAKFLTPLLGIGLAMGTAYLPMVFMNLVSLRHKVEDHKLMMSHIDRFRLQDAKCSVESDRHFIESHVGKLFVPEADGQIGWDRLSKGMKAEALESFNSFVRGSFKQSVCTRLGSVSRVPYQLALLAFMPLSFASLANVLGCDGMECEMAAKIEGYSSVQVFMLTNSFSWTIGIFLIYPTTYAVMLRGLQFCSARFSRTPTKLAASALIIALSYYYMGFMEGLAAAITVNAVTGGTALWHLAEAIFLAYLISLNYLIFRSDFKLESGAKCTFRGPAQDL